MKLVNNCFSHVFSNLFNNVLEERPRYLLNNKCHSILSSIFLTDVFTFLHGFLSLPALNYFSTYLEIGYKIKLNILTSVSFFYKSNQYVHLCIYTNYLFTC